MLQFTPRMQYDLEETQQNLGAATYPMIGRLEITAWRTREPVPFEQRFTGQELHLQVGDPWGELFDCAWFRFRGCVPEAAAGQEIALLLDVNGEMCVVDTAGVPQRGLTNVASTYDYSLGLPGKRVLPLLAQARGGENIEVWADAGCNDLFGRLQENGVIKEAFIAVCRADIRALYYDFEVLLDSLKVLSETSPRFQQILNALLEATWLVRGGLDADTVRQARQRLATELQKRGGDPVLRISAIGHAHIDLGWLWPLRETRRKGARTFATALANLERYPDYIFAGSQAQLFQWMKESYPEMYEKVRQRVFEKRIEPQGALWVESDTNLTGGESLVRQILYGRRFFLDEFGVDVKYVWLPDTFGYSAALPQILKRAGIEFFSTQKLSWSLVNQFPYHSFHWEGIDGSRIPVHMLPEETYNSAAAARSIGKIEANYRQKDISSRALMVYGIGDGGGGPGEEHLERLERLKNFAGLSPVQQEWTSSFFECWNQEAGRFPTWSGELYLERHQGTLTTQAQNKRYNRQIEGALREWEWLACLAGQLAGVEYPERRLEMTWKEVLLYQFHDILPGSSIKRVYDETTPRYQALLEDVEAGIASCLQAIAGRLSGAGMEKPLAVFNSLGWERSAWLPLPGGWQQVLVPPMGYTVVDAGAPGEIPAVFASPERLENDRLAVRFDPHGAISSVFDKLAGREVIAAGESANRLAVYRDMGDAWDFALDYAETAPRFMELTAVAAGVDGPRAILTQEYRLGHSILRQTISLEWGSARLEFSTQATWRETNAMLRVAFPVAIQANEAAYEIQFGHIYRPTHRNTTWDTARSETAGQKWAGLARRDYGAALLNDSKYAYQIKGHVIDLNLIRSVPYPGPSAVQEQAPAAGEPNHAYTDQTEHFFRYALYPHRGDAVEGGVIQAAYEFNLPLRTVELGGSSAGLPQQQAFLQTDAETVVVETIKRAEETGGWIVRLYEAGGGNARATVQCAFPVAGAVETNLVEEPLRELAVEGNRIELAFRPFEIKTLLVKFV